MVKDGQEILIDVGDGKSLHSYVTYSDDDIITTVDVRGKHWLIRRKDYRKGKSVAATPHTPKKADTPPPNVPPSKGVTEITKRVTTSGEDNAMVKKEVEIVPPENPTPEEAELLQPATHGIKPMVTPDDLLADMMEKNKRFSDVAWDTGMGNPFPAFDAALGVKLADLFGQDLEDLEMRYKRVVTSHAILVEAGELAKEIDFEWWKTKKVVRDNVVEESVDILHFLFALLEHYDVGPLELHMAYVKKNEVNWQRLKERLNEAE